uniref:Integrase zinc-binding domain-containing protein n=1 Tax=Anopheles christyi TaxID=43041 RepID=A0A182KH50_9DIPT
MHVPGSSNPADLVSRGMSATDFLKSKLWGFGSDWLALSPSHWPNSYPEPVDETNLEIHQVSAAVMKTPTNHPWFTLCSSFKRLLRIVAYCIRFTRNSKEKARTQQTTICNPTPFVITPEDMEAANTVLCRLAQQDAFSTELELLQKGNDVPKQSPLRTLNPFLDQQGIIRVGGRLRLSQLPYQAKHPVLLPKKHPFAQLICRYHHEELRHGGGRLLLSRVREEYWPLHGRHLVKGIPAHKRAAPGKSYLSVFICFSTKAVHLELVGDLTTAGELHELFAMFRDEQQLHQIATDCANRGISWQFISPKAPHFGGLWEAAVKTAKRHLFNGSSTRLSYEGYSTILRQIEAAMNSRPLLPMSDDLNDLSALTPAHFLIGTSMHAVPEPDYSHLRSCTLSDLQKWKLVQRFWKHWTYLQEMQRDNSKLKRYDNIIPGRRFSPSYPLATCTYNPYALR